MIRLLFVCSVFSSSVVAKKPFNEYKENISSIQTIRVFTDALILDDFGNNVRGLDLEHNELVNKKLFNKISYYLAETLSASFKHVHSSIGMHQPNNLHVTDTYNINNQITLPVIVQVSENQVSSNHLSSLDFIFESMLYRTEKRGINKQYQQFYAQHTIDEVADLELQKGEAAMFYLIEGAKIPDKKRGNKTAMSLLLSLGTVFTVELSVYRTYVVLTDNEGRVLWSAVSGKPGDILEDDDLTTTIWRSFKRFPVRVKNRSVR